MDYCSEQGSLADRFWSSFSLVRKLRTHEDNICIRSRRPFSREINVLYALVIAHKDQIEASRCVYTNCTENLNHEFSLPFPHTLVLNSHCDRMMFELRCDKILFNSGSLVRSRIDRSAMVSSSIVDIAIAEHGSFW